MAELPETLPTETLYVTHAAARAYAEYRGLELELERARRELTVLLLGAPRKLIDRDRSGLYRIRSRAANIDISARVKRDGAMLVVVDAMVKGRH